MTLAISGKCFCSFIAKIPSALLAAAVAPGLTITGDMLRKENLLPQHTLACCRGLHSRLGCELFFLFVRNMFGAWVDNKYHAMNADAGPAAESCAFVAARMSKNV